MALIKCPDCQTDVSDLAPACPKCGRPVARFKIARRSITSRLLDVEQQAADGEISHDEYERQRRDILGDDERMKAWRPRPWLLTLALVAILAVSAWVSGWTAPEPTSGYPRWGPPVSAGTGSTTRNSTTSRVDCISDLWSRCMLFGGDEETCRQVVGQKSETCR